MNHNAILVTVGLEEEIKKIREWIQSTKAPVIESPAVINGYITFVMYPDGSKEGWGHSVEGDRQRDVFVAWLEDQSYNDGSNSFHYIEVSYGELGVEIVRTNQ